MQLTRPDGAPSLADRVPTSARQRQAERDLLKKIHFYNGKKRGRYLARVAFAPGDAERVMRLGAEKGNFFDSGEED